MLQHFGYKENCCLKTQFFKLCMSSITRELLERGLSCWCSCTRAKEETLARPFRLHAYAVVPLKNSKQMAMSNLSTDLCYSGHRSGHHGWHPAGELSGT